MAMGLEVVRKRKGRDGCVRTLTKLRLNNSHQLEDDIVRV